jgi:hypothetical protein
MSLLLFKVLQGGRADADDANEKAEAPLHNNDSFKEVIILCFSPGRKASTAGLADCARAAENKQ